MEWTLLMTPVSQYMVKRTRLNPNKDELALDSRWLFVGIDLAPNEQLESGLTVIDRERTLLRMDKLYSDASIKQALSNLAGLGQCIVALDMPKNLSLSGKFLQEEIKLHPLRLNVPHLAQRERFSPRGRAMYDWVETQGALTMLYYSYAARLHFELMTPYRSRTSQGCRALQTAIRNTLGIRNMPNNLAPSSVLDAIVGAYCAWLVYVGQEDIHYRLFEDDDGRRTVQAAQRFDWDNMSQRPEWVPC
jgi:hypothetical protein